MGIAKNAVLNFFEAGQHIQHGEVMPLAGYMQLNNSYDPAFSCLELCNRFQSPHQGDPVYSLEHRSRDWVEQELTVIKKHKSFFLFVAYWLFCQAQSKVKSHIETSFKT